MVMMNVGGSAVVGVGAGVVGGGGETDGAAASGSVLVTWRDSRGSASPSISILDSPVSAVEAAARTFR